MKTDEGAVPAERGPALTYVGFAVVAVATACAAAVAAYLFRIRCSVEIVMAVGACAVVWLWPIPAVVTYLAARSLFEWGAVEGNTASLAAVIVGVGVLLGAAGRIVSDRVRVLRAPGMIGWTALAVVVLASGALNGRLPEGFRLAGKLLLGVAPYLLILTYVRTRRQFNIVYWAVAASGVLPVIVAAHQYARQAGVIAQGYYRVFSTFSSFSKFGMHICFVAFLCLGAALVKGHTRPQGERRTRTSGWPGLGARARVALLLAAAVCGVFMYLTYVRGCYVAFAVGTITAAALVRGAKRMWLVVAGLLLAGILAVSRDTSIVARFQQMRFEQDRTQNSFTRRLGLWRQGMEFFRQNPVMGKGPGFFRDSEELDVHNDFVRALAEFGLVGFVALAAALAGAARCIIGAARSREGPVYAKAALVAATASVALLLLSENLIFAVGTQTYFWSFVGLLAVSDRVWREDAPRATSGSEGRR